MKRPPWILVILLVLALVFSWSRKTTPETKVIRDTVTVIDTFIDSVPRTFLVRFDHWDTVYFPLMVNDSDLTDSIPFVIPIEKKEYRTDHYRAIVSGYKPSLDLVEIYSKTQTITVTPKKKRWGLGLQAGYGYPGGWYVGAGISYNLINW